MSLMHSEAVLDATRAFLRARLPSEFAAVTSGPIHDLESLCSAFDAEYPSVQKKVEIHEMAPVVDGDRASVRVKVTFRYSGPDKSSDWTHKSDGVVHLQRESAGWRVEDFVDNRRSQRAGVFLEPVGEHEFADIKVAPLCIELSHMGLLVVFQVLNRAKEPVELVFGRLRHKACRVTATVPERPHVAPPGVTTTSLVMFPIALPVETPKLRLEFGMIGTRSSTAYNVAFDVGLHAAKLDPPKAKKWQGRRTNLSLAARLGLGAAALFTLMAGLTQLPEPVVANVPAEGSPPAASAVALEFVEATFERDRAAALDLLSKYAPEPAKQVDDVIEALRHERRDKLGAPQTAGRSGGGGSTMVTRIGYPFVDGMCSLGRPEIRSWIVMDLVEDPKGWKIVEAYHAVEDEPCDD